MWLSVWVFKSGNYKTTAAPSPGIKTNTNKHSFMSSFDPSQQKLYVHTKTFLWEIQMIIVFVRTWFIVEEHDSLRIKTFVMKLPENKRQCD
jgi:hypothetical protein